MAEYNINSLTSDIEVKPTVQQGMNRGVMARPQGINSDTTTESSDFGIESLKKIVSAIKDRYEGDSTDLEDTPVRGRDVADGVYSEFDKLIDLREESLRSAEEVKLMQMEQDIKQSRKKPYGVIENDTKEETPNVKSLPEQDSITATELDDAVVGGASDGKVDEGLMSRPIDADAKRAISEVDLAPNLAFVNDKDTTQGKTERSVYEYAYQQGIKGDELKSFMAQVGHESGKFNDIEESGYLWKNTTSFSKARKAGLVKNNITKDNATSEKIFNSMYEGVNGNGNYASGDGSTYKGRGYIQLTGRDNYRQIGEDIGVDLETKPELMLDPAVARKASVAWWKRNVQSKNPDYTDTEAITRIINGGINGLAERKKLFSRYGEIVTAVDTSLRPKARPTRLASN